MDDAENFQEQQRIGSQEATDLQDNLLPPPPITASY